MSNLPFKISSAKKLAGVKCCAYGCNSKPVYKKGNLCHKHYRRKLRASDPVQIRYADFCYKARSRGKENTITLEEFRNFCERTGYIITKGKRGQNATLDRRCNVHGYHIWNLQLLTNRQNASKGASHAGDNFDGKHHDLPF